LTDYQRLVIVNAVSTHHFQFSNASLLDLYSRIW
jgi:hypothetical protein